MKIPLALTALLFANFALAQFPLTKQVEVTMLDVWPSTAGIRFTARIDTAFTDTQCTNNSGFAIKEGPGADAAYSTLLAGVLAGKTIEIYLTECGYFPIADRIRLIP